jgi:hypothetical protein
VHTTHSTFMKRIIAVLLILATALLAQARLLKSWSYQELYDQSDLVVIAQPISTQDTTEKATLPGFNPDLRVVGLSTEFDISLVMKGDKSAKKATLHHYRLSDPMPGRRSPPSLTSFDSKQHPRYLLFLQREADGRYAPMSGQTDPVLFSVVKLEGEAK